MLGRGERTAGKGMWKAAFRAAGGKSRKYVVSGKVFPNELIYETETDSQI